MKIYDLVVIGGGPAGLIAAGRAAELGAKVLVLEKNQYPGLKLLITGGGRCNFSNYLSPRLLSEALSPNGRWLLSSLHRFGPQETIAFFENQGLETKVEANSRVFPASNKAREVLETLLKYLAKGAGEIRYKAEVFKIVIKEQKISKLILSDKTEVSAANFIIATGGRSYPGSGSSGDAYSWLRNMGHTIVEPRAAISKIIVKESIEALEGLSISSALITLFKAGKKVKSEAGDFLFTKNALSGPAALNLSRAAARQKIEELGLKIDFFPDDHQDELDDKIKQLLEQNKQLSVKNILSKISHKRLALFALEQNNINPNKKGNGLSKTERRLLLNFFKGYKLNIASLGGFNEAMITVGGVDLKEVNPKTMASKLISNLYLAGEILDLDGPTGGYNLQIAWTSGYLAGERAALSKKTN